MQLRLSGRIALVECRHTRAGVPVLLLEMHGDRGQLARVTHNYPDASVASGIAARTLAACLRGQQVELDLVEPLFRKGRLEAVAPVIVPPVVHLRKDLS